MVDEAGGEVGPAALPPREAMLAPEAVLEGPPEAEAVRRLVERELGTEAAAAFERSRSAHEAWLRERLPRAADEARTQVLKALRQARAAWRELRREDGEARR
ncbi:MAG: hypothetical protein ACYCU0_13575 [Solirubrobacteraceae bacterium]